MWISSAQARLHNSLNEKSTKNQAKLLFVYTKREPIAQSSVRNQTTESTMRHDTYGTIKYKHTIQKVTKNGSATKRHTHFVKVFFDGGGGGGGVQNENVPFAQSALNFLRNFGVTFVISMRKT